MALLVSDSTAWVEFFRGAESTLLETGLAAGIVEIPAFVKLGLLGNPLGTKERKALEQVLADLPVIGLGQEHLQRAALLKAQLHNQGIAINARDAHVLQCAKDRNAILISNDPLFLAIRKTAGLRVEMW